MDNALFSLKGKVALVTGASRGLGKAMAIALAKAGADIIGVGPHGLGSTKDEVEKAGQSAYEIIADFREENIAPTVAQKAKEAFGKVDILVNNAGIIKLSPAQCHSMSDYDEVMNVNLRFLFELTKEIAGDMIERREGKIINICSIQSIAGGGGDSAYVASKHALLGLTRAYANEWGKYNIQVNGIAPGYMITDNTATLRQNKEAVAAITERIPAGRWGEPCDLAGPVVFLASHASDFVNGHMLVVDGGYLNN